MTGRPEPPGQWHQYPSDSAERAAVFTVGGTPASAGAHPGVRGAPVDWGTVRPRAPHRRADVSQPTGTAPAAAAPFQTRAGAYALIVLDGSVLLSAWRSPSGEVFWTLPGGGIELGEGPEQACVREVFEETGHDCRLTGLLGVTTGHIPAAKRLRGEGVDLLTVQVHYRAEITGGTLRPEVDGSSHDARWFALDGLDAVRTSPWLTSSLRLGGHLPPEADA